MIDFFAVLDENRRPWGDPEALKSKFLKLSALTHPDLRGGGEPSTNSSAELNAAYSCLKEPRERIRHLLELETGKRSPDFHQIPDQLVEYFMSVGRIAREGESRLRRRRGTTSPILQVNLFAEDQALAEEARALQEKIQLQIDDLLLQIKALDARWAPSGTTHSEQLRELEEVYRRLSFFNRWSSQLRELVVQLALY